MVQLAGLAADGPSGDGGLVRREIRVQGTVQGVGFRPHVYNLAARLGLTGWVLNSAQGVLIEVEGPAEAVGRFEQELQASPPPLAVITGFASRPVPPVGSDGFRIVPSRQGEQRLASVPADAATCPDCRAELLDPANRRHRYPFTNCTNCGPRFTIVQDIPYDRPMTTMSAFPMCPACEQEYHAPGDRRFHAQPNACPVCGPQIRLTDPAGRPVPGDWLAAAAGALRAGRILAVKGLGGYHLACDAANPEAVALLRRRKGRPHRPLAVMARDLELIRQICRVSPEEEALLRSPAAPIVLLERLAPPAGAENQAAPGAVASDVAPNVAPDVAPNVASDVAPNVASDVAPNVAPDVAPNVASDVAPNVASDVAPNVAPGLSHLGVMLPYTPLHLLLLSAGPPLLVMTSGNPTGLPLVTGESEALERLGQIADLFVTHDRPIHVPCDDSVLQVVDSVPFFHRRSRGYAPRPIALGKGCGGPTALGMGGDLKSTFCLLDGERAVFSQHLGDLECEEGRANFRRALQHLQRLTGIEPAVTGCDMHPRYASSALARELQAGHVIPVQHHHAHLAACLADNQVSGEAIGLILDGTGYGTDGAIWGFELLAGDTLSFRRLCHLAYSPLPGGEGAIRRPLMAAAGLFRSHLGEAGVERLSRLLAREGEIPPEFTAALGLLHHGINAPPAGTAGRLFDGIAAVLGICRRQSYEGQAAIELGAAAAPGDESPYPFLLAGGEFRLEPALAALLADLEAGVERSLVAGRFLQTVAAMLVSGAVQAREATGLSQVCLGGGTFQSAWLLQTVVQRLTAVGFMVHRPRQVPPGDGGLALGQAVIARRRWQERCV